MENDEIIDALNMSFDDLSEFDDDSDADPDYTLVCFYYYYLFMIHRFRYRVAWMGLTDYFNLFLSIFTFKKIEKPVIYSQCFENYLRIFYYKII